MADKIFSTPAEIAASTVETGTYKALSSPSKLLLLSFLAGAFIAFAAEGSNMAAFNLFADPAHYGLGKMVAGLVFPAGLMLVIIAGAELFTGNTLIFMSVLSRRTSVWAMLNNWFWVYLGNFIGSLFIAYMMANSGLFNSGNAMLGGVTLKIAAYKTQLDFMPAFYLGIMCNWLVCLGVWLAYGAKTLSCKVMGIFFPIFLFITSGFEHCVANMYYIPAAIFAKDNPAWVAASHLDEAALAQISWSGLAHNLLPVTLGNIVGGAVFVGAAYFMIFLHRKQETAKATQVAVEQR